MNIYLIVIYGKNTFKFSERIKANNFNSAYLKATKIIKGLKEYTIVQLEIISIEKL